MDLKEFTAAMACAVQKEISGEAVVRPQTVSKNNGVVLQGLLFQKEGCKNAPTIYLEPYYQAFREGEDFTNLAQQVAACYKKYALIQDFQADFFLHYEDVRETIAYKLVNYGKNRKLLADVPHLPYLDLAMVFYSLIHHPEIGAATILIHGSHLNMWKATHRMLYEDAKRNTPRLLEASLIPMKGILYGSTQGQTEKFPPIYVLTNKERMNGAASLLYEGMLEQCTYLGRLFPFTGSTGISVNSYDIVKYLKLYWYYLGSGVLLCIPSVSGFYEKHRKHPAAILFTLMIFWLSVSCIIRMGSNPFAYLKF